jgi:hypothetical protein
MDIVNLHDYEIFINTVIQILFSILKKFVFVVGNNLFNLISVVFTFVMLAGAML